MRAQGPIRSTIRRAARGAKTIRHSFPVPAILQVLGLRRVAPLKQALPDLRRVAPAGENRLMLEFAKVACNLPRNPKIRDAGWEGYCAYFSLLLLNAELDLDGIIPARFARPEYLAREWGAPSSAFVSSGIESCLREALLVREDDGSLRIAGWDSSWRPAVTSTERVRQFRERQSQRAQLRWSETDTTTIATDSECSKSEHETPNETTRERTETERNSVMPIDETRLDKTRLETETETFHEQELGKPQNQRQRNLVRRHLRVALTVLADLSAARMRLKPASRAIRPSYDSLSGICERLESGKTLEECQAVVAACERECRGNKDAFKWFDAVTPWRSDNFLRKLSSAPPEKSTVPRRAAPATLPPMGLTPEELK